MNFNYIVDMTATVCVLVKRTNTAFNTELGGSSAGGIYRRVPSDNTWNYTPSTSGSLWKIIVSTFADRFEMVDFSSDFQGFESENRVVFTSICAQHEFQDTYTRKNYPPQLAGSPPKLIYNIQ